MSVESIENLVISIREEFGYARGIPPSVVEVIERNSTSLHIIVSDRSEKSLMIGPGGRIAAELSKRLNRKVSIHGADELLMKVHRLKLTLIRIEDLISIVNQRQKEFLTILRNLVILEMNYPRSDISDFNQLHRDISVGVAFSGGIDSSAALLTTTRIISSVTALTANMGPRFIDPREKARIKDISFELGSDIEIIEDLSERESLIQNVEAGNIHPCGTCHEITMRKLKEHATEKELDVLVTGELLPTGRQSIEFVKGLLIVHFPAALALTKYRTKEIGHTIKPSSNMMRFGCTFLASQHRTGWSACGPSIFRVLRELQGGVLSTGEALSLIKSILLPAIKVSKEEQESSIVE
ncbi:MAG: hypothetical protein ACFFED_08145 [Candidatus Thorarchaeota archaeon]